MALQYGDFGIATGLRVMKRTIPIWRAKVEALGDEQGSIAWARSECERYLEPPVVIRCSEGLSDAESVKKMWPMNWMDRFNCFSRKMAS